MNVYFKRFPPSLNHMYGAARDGSRYMAAKLTDFYTNAYYDYLEQGRPKIPEEWKKTKVEIVFFPERNREKWDVDNVVKPVFDALTKLKVWKDDSCVYSFTAKKGPKVGKGGVRVKIDEYVETDSELDEFALKLLKALEGEAENEKRKTTRTVRPRNGGNRDKN